MQKIPVWLKVILSKATTYKNFFIGPDVVKSKIRENWNQFLHTYFFSILILKTLLRF